jgi:site-specific recombinase XerD
MGGIRHDKPAASCAECFSWGVLPGQCCRACYTFRQLHDHGECAACQRIVPTNKGYCRLCWLQALHEAKAAGQSHVSEPFLLGLRHHQLFFARMHRDYYRVLGRTRLGKPGRRSLLTAAAAAEPGEPATTGWIQLRLPFQPRRDFSRFDRRRRTNDSNPTLVHARQAARMLAESRGWSHWVAHDVDRALVVVLSNHTNGDTIRFTELAPALRRRGLSAERTIDVLDHLQLFDDDRISAFETWLERKLDAMTPGIRRDVEAWLRVLRHGSPRNHARHPETAWSYLNEIRPVLLSWSARHGHLREVTRADILDATNALKGSKRHVTLSVLRSLFRHCRQTGTIFRNPAIRIRPSHREYSAILPLRTNDIREAFHAATTPADRLAVVLAAVHAARTTDIRNLHLDDVDLGNRRIVVASRVRPLDDLTHQALLDWLESRRSRWPNTANPHLLINRLTALEAGPVSRVWVTRRFWGLTATLERLHVDRQLEEALAHGPDPVHLTAVFGIHENTAIRYAEAARQILETPAEQHDPGSP